MFPTPQPRQGPECCRSKIHYFAVILSEWPYQVPPLMRVYILSQIFGFRTMLRDVALKTTGIELVIRKGCKTARTEKTEGRSPPLSFAVQAHLVYRSVFYCLRPERRQGRAHPPRGPHEIQGFRVARDRAKTKGFSRVPLRAVSEQNYNVNPIPYTPLLT